MLSGKFIYENITELRLYDHFQNCKSGDVRDKEFSKESFLCFPLSHSNAVKSHNFVFVMAVLMS